MMLRVVVLQAIAGRRTAFKAKRIAFRDPIKETTAASSHNTLSLP
jgi:hypothetical protein